MHTINSFVFPRKFLPSVSRVNLTLIIVFRSFYDIGLYVDDEVKKNFPVYFSVLAYPSKCY